MVCRTNISRPFVGRNLYGMMSCWPASLYQFVTVQIWNGSYWTYCIVTSFFLPYDNTCVIGGHVYQKVPLYKVNRIVEVAEYRSEQCTAKLVVKEFGGHLLLVSYVICYLYYLVCLGLVCLSVQVVTGSWRRYSN